MKIKELVNKDTTSLIFKCDLFYQLKLRKLLNLLKINNCCIELYYVDNYNLECVNYLENHQINFANIKLNNYQNKLVINFNITNFIYLDELLSEFEFEQISLWDKNVVLNDNLETQLKNTNLYLNFNSQEDNIVELIYNNIQYNFLNKSYLQKNFL